MGVTTSFLSGIQNPGGKNIIYVGKYSSLPAQWKNYLPNDNFSTGAGIKIVHSPYDANHVLMLVVSDNESDLSRAVKFLENDKLVAQVQNDYCYVDRSINVLTKDAVAGSSLSFSSLGYDGITLKGAFNQSAEMAVKLPKGRVPNANSTMTLNFRYSENLDFTRSLVTAYVNGVPIGSKKLVKENAGDDSLTLSIPQEARKTNYLDIRIVFDLDMTDQWCVKRQEDMPWAYLKGSSQISLPTEQVDTNLFENYPSPFVSGGEWSNTAFVLPSGYTWQTSMRQEK